MTKIITLLAVLAACVDMPEPARCGRPPRVEWPATWDAVDEQHNEGVMMTELDHDALWRQVGELQAWADACAIARVPVPEWGDVDPGMTEYVVR